MSGHIHSSVCDERHNPCRGKFSLCGVQNNDIQCGRIKGHEGSHRGWSLTMAQEFWS